MKDNKQQEVYVKVTKNGPYMLYGISEVSREIILHDEEGIGVEYKKDKVFYSENSPICLCRCGKSNNAPFCDGMHSLTNFDGTETACFDPILKDAKIYEGPTLTLADNEKYCAFARFCDADGGIWNLIFKEDELSATKVIREANLCPAGRLLVFDKQGKLLEDNLPQSVALLEDGGLKISGPLWLRGKIRVESADGKNYEIRGKQTLCRCGKSKNKPFCDSSHKYIEFCANYPETI